MVLCTDPSNRPSVRDVCLNPYITGEYLCLSDKIIDPCKLHSLHPLIALPNLDDQVSIICFLMLDIVMNIFFLYNTEFFE